MQAEARVAQDFRIIVTDRWMREQWAPSCNGGSMFRRLSKRGLRPEPWLAHEPPQSMRPNASGKQEKESYYAAVSSYKFLDCLAFLTAQMSSKVVL